MLYNVLSHLILTTRQVLSVSWLYRLGYGGSKNAQTLSEPESEDADLTYDARLRLWTPRCPVSARHQPADTWGPDSGFTPHGVPKQEDQSMGTT